MKGEYNRAQDQAGQPEPAPVVRAPWRPSRPLVITVIVVGLLLYGTISHLLAGDSEATKFCKRAWHNGGDVIAARTSQSEGAFIDQCIKDGQDMYNLEHGNP